jgi:ABC-type nitrate/sulfonate/bicarbonate transport system permease component
VRVLGPVAVFALVVALWWAVTALGWIDPLVLPSPIAVAAEFWNDGGTLAYNAGVTAAEAITGLVIGNAIGLLLAIIFVGSPTSRRSVLPLAMAAQSVPIVAVTPALIIAFGMRGLRSADAEVGELLHSLSASSFQRLWMVRLPAALPFIFTALKFSACSCFVAAIVAEWVAADRGLGYLIVFESSQYRNAEVWAAVIIGTVSSMALVGLVVLIERWAMPWARHTA